MNRTHRSITMKAASVLAAFSGLAASPALAQSVGTVFTYQGELRSGGTVQNGAFDMRFSLFDASAGGSQVGVTLCFDNVQVADGKFTVQLDFGAQFTGSQRFLELQVRADTGLNCSNTAGFTTLSPRQNLTASPNALWASNANALGGQPAGFFQNANNLTSGTIPDGRLSSNVAVRNAPNTFTSSITATSFSGSGAGLTGLSASNVSTGTLDDGRLSGNVALRNAANTFTASNIFNTPVRIGTNTTVSGQTGLTVRAPTSGTSYSGMYVDSQDAVGRPFYGFATNGTFRAWTEFDGATNEWALINMPAASDGPIMKCNAFGNMIFRRNVGINTGTVTPGSRLHVNGPALTGVNIFTGDLAPIGAAGIETNFSSAGIGSNALIYLAVDGSERFSVRPTGDVVTYNSTSNSFAVLDPFSSSTNLPELRFTDPGNPSGTGFTVGVSVESVAGIPMVNLDNNFRLEARNTVRRGGALRIDSRPTESLFQFWHRAGGGTSETPCASLDHLGNFSAVGRVSGVGTGIGQNAGGYFTNAAVNADAVAGFATSTSGGAFGVYGLSNSTSGIGVFGSAPANTGVNYGVYGGTNSAADGWGVYSVGRLGASGPKLFRIDHPADPENKYLQHYCAESPEVINFYRGTVTLDGAGEAVVTLPAYFASINKDPSYTLTAVGAPMPMLHVLSEIDPGTLDAGAKARPGDDVPLCTFVIGGGVPGGRVSWRVEAVRNDAWVRAYGAPVEVEKQGLERGTYQHPELYGQPKERALHYREQAPAPAPEEVAATVGAGQAQPAEGGF